MDNNPLVSIIVPVYKVEKYLDECIASLVKQTYANLEIILVDDGSPDNCPAMCDAWKMRDSRIKVIHKANGGLPDARNAGIQIAAGQWLLFIDSDDAVPSCFVEALISSATSDDILVTSGIERFGDSIPVHTDCIHTQKKCGKKLAPTRGGLYCCGALYSKEIVQCIGLSFDKSLRNIEDVVWNSIYLRYISEVIYVNVPYFYRKNPTSITSKCGDVKWQVASWIAARGSIMNWFSGKPLTPAQTVEVRAAFRHCQNNIYAECVAGSISFDDLKSMEHESSAPFDKHLISLPEKLILNYFSKLYYNMYTFILRAKNAIRK